MYSPFNILRLENVGLYIGKVSIIVSNGLRRSYTLVLYVKSEGTELNMEQEKKNLFKRHKFKKKMHFRLTTIFA